MTDPWGYGQDHIYTQLKIRIPNPLESSRWLHAQSWLLLQYNVTCGGDRGSRIRFV